VITTVGPYARYGENLIAACCKYGVDYIDLTGEFEWAKRMTNKYNEEAKRSSARIVNFGGFVSSIPDCGLYTLIKHMKDNAGVSNNESFNVYIYYDIKGTAMSGGTTESWFNALHGDSAKNVNDPYYLNSGRKQDLPAQPTLKLPRSVTLNNKQYSTIPWIYAGVDKMAICQTNFLTNMYGKQTIFNLDGIVRSTFTAWVMTLIGLIFNFLLQFALFRKFFTNLRPLFTKPGEGPSREQMLRSRTIATIIAETKDKKKKSEMKVSMKSDVGYYLTSRILCEEGLAFVDQRRATATNKNEKITGGCMTPGAAFGETLYERLKKVDVFEYEIRK